MNMAQYASYTRLPKVNKTIQKVPLPTKVLQFGEGNFLRAFADEMIDTANKASVFHGGIQIVKPIKSGTLAPFYAQDCVYTVILRGKLNGKSQETKRVITSIIDAVDPYESYDAYNALAKCSELKVIISNTTEAGIVYHENDMFNDEPPESFPGKLVKFLFSRYMAFNGAIDKGCIILPTELIERNGSLLKEICLKLSALWDLPYEFNSWLTQHNIFCDTLVDRIVSGFPTKDIHSIEKDLQYTDELITVGEPYALWVIQSDQLEEVSNAFPLDKAGLPVLFTNDLLPYRECKVRVLNGAHTLSAVVSYCMGLETVGDIMGDKDARQFLFKALFNEIVPMVPLPAQAVQEYAESVLERFENPDIRHYLSSILMYSLSKFRSRLLPILRQTWERKAALPPLICFSLGALMAFYSGLLPEKYMSHGIAEDEAVLTFFREHHMLTAPQLTVLFLREKNIWGEDLTAIPSLANLISKSLIHIQTMGMRTAVVDILKNLS